MAGAGLERVPDERVRMSQGMEESAALAGRVDLVRLNSVRAQEAAFLWKPYLPRGRITILEGDPGLGKTWLCLEIAARLSRGERLPRCLNQFPLPRPPPCPVLFLNGEDGPGDTLRPRLEAAGADLTRLVLLAGYREGAGGPRRHLHLQRLDYIEAVLRQMKPGLLVVDPVQAFLGPKLAMGSPSQVRSLLLPLADLAQGADCAVLLVRHLAKSAGERPIYRGLGSVDFAAAARSVLLVGKDPGSREGRVVTHVKSSLAREGDSLQFSIDEGKFVWRGVSEVRAQDLLAREPTAEDRSALSDAQEFLKEFLSRGPKPLSEIKQRSKGEGISWTTLIRARQGLRVQSDRAQGQCRWQLPPQAPAQRG